MIGTQYAATSGISIDQVFHNQDFVNLIGNRDSYGRFRISNIVLARRNEDEIEPLYPIPAYLVEDEAGKLRLIPVPKDNVHSNMPDKMQYLVPERETKGKIEPVEGWLSLTDLLTVLQPGTDISKLKIVRAGEIYEREPRIGIGMDSRRKVAEEGLLYSTQMLRMKERYGFLTTIYIAKDQNSDERDDQATQLIYDVLKKSGWVTLGGEQRAAYFEIMVDAAQAFQSKGNLLYLATPAVFSKGWQPAKWTTQSIPIAAAISHYQPIGGWKLDALNSGGGDQKSLRRCVPAGSVYFFDQPETLPSPLGDYLEVNNNPTYIGYGITMIGDWEQ
jgi:CRISPR-associated protein Cmr3